MAHPSQKIAGLVERAVRTAGLAMATRRIEAVLQPGALFLLQATAGYAIEWAVIEHIADASGRVYVIAGDPRAPQGRYDIAVAANPTCGALSLRCAVGMWAPASLFPPESCTGHLPQEAFLQARALCRYLQRQKVDELFEPVWELESHPKRQQEVEAALELLRSLASPPENRPTPWSDPRKDDEITMLYRNLSERTHTVDPATFAGDPEINELWASLRRLQSEEADRYEAAFEATLASPIDAGRTLLARARALRKRLENPAAHHPASSPNHRT